MISVELPPLSFNLPEQITGFHGAGMKIKGAMLLRSLSHNFAAPDILGCCIW